MKKISLVVLSFVLTGCYFWKQGTALISTYSSARPLEDFLKDSQITPEERLLLERALEARKYALGTLGLRANKNYTTYIRLSRPYLADVVSACADDRFDQHLWHYPLVGALPYKGFFDREGAEEEAAALKAQGLDVMIRGVHAFSTLGWFSDPLFSFMKDYSEADITDLIIHEQTHATVFLSGQGDFNENLASFVGSRGALDYLLSRYGRDSGPVRELLAGQRDAETFRQDLHRLYLSLDNLYSRGDELGRTKVLEDKAGIIAAFQKEFRETYQDRYETPNYAVFPDRPVNNAYIMTFRNYSAGLDAFQAFYKACGEDLVRMIRELKALPGEEKDPLGWMDRRGRELQALLSSGAGED